MIITRTPMRVSLVGGGTDLPAFFHKTPGAVISFAINKYMYVSLNRKFDGQTRVSYSHTENVRHPMDLKHDIARESLLLRGIYGVEIGMIADIPGGGTGLGSSSSLAVGLEKALYKYNGAVGFAQPRDFAEYAYHIERDACLHNVGKQDHYAAAYGGLHYYQFNPDHTVIAELINYSENELSDFAHRFVLLWTGRTRPADPILKTQEANMQTDRFDLAVRMRDMAIQLRDDLKQKDWSNIGPLLHANWEIKKQMAPGISNEWLDGKYQAALQAGAQGGKLCGAGGAGFLLFYGPFGIGPSLEKATGLKAVPFEIDTQGSQVIYAT